MESVSFNQKDPPKTRREHLVQGKGARLELRIHPSNRSPLNGPFRHNRLPFQVNILREKGANKAEWVLGIEHQSFRRFIRMHRRNVRMKKYLVMAALVLLMISGIKTGALAQDVEMHITMLKEVSSNGGTYGISFELSNDVLKKVTRVFIQGPKGARVWINNTLNLNGILLSAANLSLEEFDRWFPEEVIKSISPHRHLET